MKRAICLIMLLFVMLTACSSSKESARVADNPSSEAAQSVVERYITAYRDYDAEALISTFHDNYTFMDYGMDDGPITKGNISFFINESMAEPDTWKAIFDTYTITPDGRFAALDGSFSMNRKSDGKMASVPAYVVLEIKDGLIIAETWYYNGEVFY
jgi:hypothetical protein